MQGQLPHRDFDEVYTGGLTFANALAFRELGVNLTSLRIVLFMCFLAWVPAVYYVASRFLSAHAAGGLTLLAVAYSIPNYPAPVASWYNLFFAVFGVAALLRYIETRARGWLVAAGLCGGLSIVVKISGLYFVAATLMFFVYRAQALSIAEKGESRERHSVYSVAIALGLAIFLGLLVKIILEVPGLNQRTGYLARSIWKRSVVVASLYSVATLSGMLPLFMAVAGQLGGLSCRCNSGNWWSVRWFALVRAHNGRKKPESEISGCEIRMVHDACVIAIRREKYSATDGFASADC